jgi:hypothetical protein
LPQAEKKIATLKNIVKADILIIELRILVLYFVFRFVLKTY